MNENAVCRACGNPVRWIRLPNDNLVKVNLQPSWLGTVLVDEASGYGVILSGHTVGKLPAGKLLYVRHRDTCPHGEDW